MILKYKLFEKISADYVVIVKSQQEYDQLMKLVEEEGIYSWDKIPPENFFNQFSVNNELFIYFNDNKTLGFSERIYWNIYYKNKVVLYNLQEYKNKEINSEVDPFGEENWGHIQEQLELDDFGKEIKPKKRAYSKPLQDKDLIYDVDYWTQLAVEGWLTENQGKGFWVKNRMVSVDDVFETPQLDATDVVWYGKKLKRPFINKTNDFNVRDFGIKENKEYWEIQDMTLDEIKEKLLESDIFFYNEDEKKEIYEKLIQLGFKVRPMNKEGEYNCFVNVKGRLWNYDFCESLKKPKYGSIDIREFLKIIPSFKKIKNSDVDPFEEEEWGYVKENIDFDKQLAFMVDNEEEYEKLIDYLYSLGYHYFAERIGYIDMNDGIKPIVYAEKNKRITRSSLEYYIDFEKNNYPLYIFSEIMKVNKKINPEVDPFGEEYWGYE